MNFFDRFNASPTQDNFAQIILDALRKAGDKRQTTYDKAQFRLLHSKDGHDVGMTNLRNLFNEYCAAHQDDRREMLTRMSRGLLHSADLPEEFEDVKPDLMPTLRSRTMLEILHLDALIGGAQSSLLPCVPVTENLVICLVYDLPSAMRFITQADLDNWGVSLYEAYEVAKQNLDERKFAVICIGNKLYIVEGNDSYDATRLLLTHRLDGLDVAGSPIVMPITRDALLLTGSEVENGLDILWDIADMKRDEPRSLCPMLLIYEEEEWRTWRLPQNHSLYNKYKELEVKFTSREYQEQKELLEKRNLQLGKDVFVATYSVAEKAGEFVSFCVWAKGITSWLPKTDFVGLYEPDKASRRMVAWNDLLEVADDLLHPLDNFPSRFLVNDFPTDEQIAQLQFEDWSA